MAGHLRRPSQCRPTKTPASETHPRQSKNSFRCLPGTMLCPLPTGHYAILTSTDAEQYGFSTLIAPTVRHVSFVAAWSVLDHTPSPAACGFLRRGGYRGRGRACAAAVPAHAVPQPVDRPASRRHGRSRQTRNSRRNGKRSLATERDVNGGGHEVAPGAGNEPESWALMQRRGGWSAPGGETAALSRGCATLCVCYAAGPHQIWNL